MLLRMFAFEHLKEIMAYRFTFYTSYHCRLMVQNFTNAIFPHPRKNCNQSQSDFFNIFFHFQFFWEKIMTERKLLLAKGSNHVFEQKMMISFFRQCHVQRLIFQSVTKKCSLQCDSWLCIIYVSFQNDNSLHRSTAFM